MIFCCLPYICRVTLLQLKLYNQIVKKYYTRKAVIIMSDRNLFDRYVISPFPLLRYNFDGPVGKRVLFIENKEKHFTVSFEEGMECLDLKKSDNSAYDEAEYQNGTCYIHQQRNVDVNNFLFFHFEYFDDNGKKNILPGQLFVGKDYIWSERGVEPILVELVNSITPAEKASATLCQLRD